MSLEVKVDCLLGRVETPLAPSDLNLLAEVRRVKVDWLEILDVTIEARSWEKKRKLNTKYLNKLYSLFVFIEMYFNIYFLKNCRVQTYLQNFVVEGTF